MGLAIKIILITAFIAVTVFVGFYFRKKAKSVDNYVLGGRRIGPWLAAFAYGTTYFSAVVFVGYAGQFGWRFGTAAIWIGLGNAFIGSLLPWIIIGKRTRVMTQHLGSATMPQFFGTRFNSNALKIGASMLVFIFLIPYTASLYNGLSRIFSVAYGIPYIYCIVGMAALTMLYVIVGGYVATAANDFIQGIIMLIGIVAIIGAVLAANGGFTEAIKSLAGNPSGAPIDGPLGSAQGSLTSMFGPDPINLLGVVLLTSLGTWGLPQVVHKFYVIKSEKMIAKGAIISTVFALVIAGGCYFLGSFGRLYGDVVEKVVDPETGVTTKIIFDSIIPNMINDFSGSIGGEFLIGLVILLVLAASLSTLSGLVMTSSSTLTLDFLKGNIIKKPMTEKTQLITIRSFVAVFIIISAVIAIVQANSSILFIAQLMGISWGALAGAFLAPFLYGLYWKRVNKYAVWSCFGFSAVWMTLNLILNLCGVANVLGFLGSPINAGAFSMLAGLVIVPVVTLLTKAPPKNDVDAAFSCYKKEVVVTAAIAAESLTTEATADSAQ